MRMLLTLGLVLILAGSALAQGVVFDNFENGSNNGAWSWGNEFDVIEATGGNPDGWFHNDNLDTFAPILRCQWDAADWTGDYVANAVTHIQGDFKTISSSTDYIAYYPFTVMFRNHMGTPANTEDDIFVYYNPELQYSPGVEAGWVHYEFDIPSNFVGELGELPANWMGGSYYTGNTSFPTDVTWQEVLSDIGRIEFWYFHPDYYAPFELFDVGADNILLEWQGGTVATESSTLDALKAMYR